VQAFLDSLGSEATKAALRKLGFEPAS